MQNEGSLEILAQVASEYGFQKEISAACQTLCKKRLRKFVKECVEIAVLDADQKRQDIVQKEQMPLVRKRMRMCDWSLPGQDESETK